ncbi:hypothetical protein LRS13_15110 [Svornostia abyssi]|uniref:Secreted protein n=1 Tax=Svornostia abyssi TaxID=2898438 RepID=A0ABY5PBQ9_9ACTN|nr:hypothetical protein LRS13_15110 [Parviterribacteraceae bacterium J379]
MPAPSSAWAIIDVVVVFPWAPATAIVRFSALTWPSSCPRWSSVSPRRRPSARSGFSAAMAVETTSSTSSPAGTFAAS